MEHGGKVVQLEAGLCDGHHVLDDNLAFLSSRLVQYFMYSPVIHLVQGSGKTLVNAGNHNNKEKQNLEVRINSFLTTNTRDIGNLQN